MSNQIIIPRASVSKKKEFVRNNTQLLKGVNISTVFSLTRLEAYMPMCFFSTIVGLSIVDSSHSLSLLLIIGFANTFAMIATCSFNDAEDVADDMLARSTRNIIALGKASKEVGYLVAAVAAALSITLAVMAGVIVFLIILVFLATTFLYSWRRVRIKAMPFWDVCTHIIMGGLMFLTAAWSSKEGLLLGKHVLVICSVFSLGTALALLTHQLYDYEDDIVANIRNTVIVLGRRKIYWIEGGIYFIIACLLAYEYMAGVFPFSLILSFFVVTCSIILISIALFPKQAFQVSKRVFPWATNSGAVVAILVWYIIG